MNKKKKDDVKKYSVIDTLYYGDTECYDAEMLGQMVTDGFEISGSDVLIPIGTIIKDAGRDKYGIECYKIGRHVYDILIEDMDDFLKLV